METIGAVQELKHIAVSKQISTDQNVMKTFCNAKLNRFTVASSISVLDYSIILL